MGGVCERGKTYTTRCMSAHALVCVYFYTLCSIIHTHIPNHQQGPKMDAFVTPRVQAWMEAVRDATNPAYDEVHTILKRAQVRFAEQRARM